MKKLCLELDLMNISEERLLDLKLALEVQLEDFLGDEVEDYGFTELDIEGMIKRVRELMNEYFFAFGGHAEKIGHYLALKHDQSISSGDLILEIGRSIDYLNLSELP